MWVPHSGHESLAEVSTVRAHSGQSSSLDDTLAIHVYVVIKLGRVPDHGEHVIAGAGMSAYLQPVWLFGTADRRALGHRNSGD